MFKDKQENQQQEKSEGSENKKKEIKGSISNEYKVSEGEENLVHYRLTDHASPRNRDLTKQYKPQQRIVKVTPQMFVTQFANNYTSDDAFDGVTTPGIIVRLCKNIKGDHIRSAYADELFSATKGNPKQMADLVRKKLEEKRELRVAGGNQKVYINDILHIPTEHPSYPFNPKDLGKFPEECLHDFNLNEE